jgi:hypothetical protein
MIEMLAEKKTNHHPDLFGIYVNSVTSLMFPHNIYTMPRYFSNINIYNTHIQHTYMFSPSLTPSKNVGLMEVDLLVDRRKILLLNKFNSNHKYKDEIP